MKQQQFLTYRSIASGLIYSFFEELTIGAKQVVPASVGGITLGFSDPVRGNRVVLGEKNGVPVIIRTLEYSYKNLKYNQVLNEVEMLKLLNKLRKRTKAYSIVFPKVYSMRTSKHRLTVTREYIKGKQFIELTRQKKFTYLLNLVSAYRSLSRALTDEEISVLPKRSNTMLLLSFPLYFTVAMFRSESLRKTLVALAYSFYAHSFVLFLTRRKSEYVLTHRDLHSRNMLVSRKCLYVIDPEVSVLAQKETDLAIIARYFAPELGIPMVKKLLRNSLTTASEKHNFIRLAVFYTIQILATAQLNDRFYPQVVRFAPQLRKSIIPSI